MMLLEFLQTLILAITAFIVWCYTRETKRLREESQRQTALLQRPFLFMTRDVTTTRASGPLGDLQLYNTGNSVAINVTITIEDHQVHIPVLRAGTSQQIPVLLNPESQAPRVTGDARGVMVNQEIDAQMASQGVLLAITYHNADMTPYETIERLVGGRIEILRSGRRAPASSRHRGSSRPRALG